MDETAHIRNLYRPQQPAAGAEAHNGVQYLECAPHEALRPYVFCYWQLRTAAPLTEAFRYRVVADGCIDIFLEPGKASGANINGFSDGYSLFPLGHRFQYAGIRFLPGMLPLLFRINAAELSGQTEALDSVFPALARELGQSLDENMSLEQIKTGLDFHLGRQLIHAPAPADPRLFRAIRLILQQRGHIRTESDLDTGISSRQLRRLFAFYVGDTPKTFSRIVRFQHALAQGKSPGSFYDAGYYDQAHFIREFRAFSGLTPGSAE